jgi:hypothetical protein
VDFEVCFFYFVIGFGAASSEGSHMTHPRVLLINRLAVYLLPTTILATSFFSVRPVQAVEKGLFFQPNVAASYNPLGVLLDTRLYYRLPLSTSKDILWESTKLDVGLINEWTPADNMLGLWCNIEPIAVFDLTVKAEYYKVYRMFGYGYYKLGGPTSAYDDNSLKSLSRGSRDGYWISAAPTLKVKVASFIAADQVTINRMDLGDDGYYLEWRSFTIHYSRDVDVLNNLYLLYEHDKEISVGVNHSLQWVKNAKGLSHRLCVLLTYSPTVPMLSNTFSALTAGMYLKDQMYEGRFYVGLLVGTDVRIPLGPKSDSSLVK